MGAAALTVALTLFPVSPATSAAVIPADQQAYAHCVSQRESHGNYRAINRDEQGRKQPSSARGRWQFIQSDWGHGLPYMVAERLREFGAGARAARAVRIELQQMTIDRWPAVLQDVAFMAVLNARGKWSGTKHWHLKGSRCNSLAGA